MGGGALPWPPRPVPPRTRHPPAPTRAGAGCFGRWGLLLTYVACGVCSNLASVLLLPSNTLGLGASGAVFGLFTVAVAARVSLRSFSWRSWVSRPPRRAA